MFFYGCAHRLWADWLGGPSREIKLGGILPHISHRPRTHARNKAHKYKPLILNWFKAKGAIPSGAVEGMNLKAKLTMRKAYGFRTLKCLQIALYHELGKLPEPDYLHRFC